jgi:hypothetical protein
MYTALDSHLTCSYSEAMHLSFFLSVKQCCTSGRCQCCHAHDASLAILIMWKRRQSCMWWTNGGWQRHAGAHGGLAPPGLCQLMATCGATRHWCPPAPQHHGTAGQVGKWAVWRTSACAACCEQLTAGVQVSAAAGHCCMLHGVPRGALPQQRVMISLGVAPYRTCCSGRCW